MPNPLADLQARLAYRFADPQLLTAALTHRSAGAVNNERLEFLGDSVLSCVISAALFRLRPELPEGDLSRLRSRLVRGSALAVLSAELGLPEVLIMGPGELRSGGFQRESIQADAFEAVLGAVYLDGGFAACEGVILRLYDAHLADLPDTATLKDPKTRLQEWLQARGVALPSYELVASAGKAHERQFTVACHVAHANLRVEARGSSRRKAEQCAAETALGALHADGGTA
ncbi:MAG: ribonuclease III [Pseudomonadota bacterium]